MVRIFEALEQAANERNDRPNVIEFPEPLPPENLYGDQIQAKMRELYRMICAHCPGPIGQAVQFVGPRRGVGTSRLLRTLARVCAGSLKKSVLIVDTDIASPQFTHFSIEPVETWADALRRGTSPRSVIHKVPHSNIHLLKAFRDTESAAALLESPLLRQQMDGLKESFGLILVDSAAADVSPDGLEISPVVDGTILVVQAERTRWQVARAVTERIKERGGHVAGVLLNELRLHIPAAVYDRL
jgi:MinD-like ATPase involved in chromosome partitioning or flagellar assembly